MLNGHCKCKSGNQVVSYSEQQIDDWLYDFGLRAIYEPEIPVATEAGYLLPDWLLLPQQGLTKPVIIEYWGLLRTDNRAEWVEARLPRYLEKKHFKETIYQELDDYHYLGILPENLSEVWLARTLQEIGWKGNPLYQNSEPEIRTATDWKFRIYRKQT